MRLLNLVLRVCAILGALLDLALVWLILEEAVSPLQGLGIHAALCGVVATLLAGCSRTGSPWGWAALATVVGFTIPGVGLLAVTTAEIGSCLAGKGTLFSQYSARMVWGTTERRVLRPIEDTEARIRLELSVQPLAEILSRGTAQERRRALLAIAHEGVEEAARALALALDDPDPDVRFVAGMTLVHVEEKCGRRIAQATAQIRQTPESASAHILLGDSYWSYAESGLLDPAGRDRCLECARKAYLAARERDPKLGGVLLSLARVHLAQDAPERALAALDDLLATSPGSAEGLVLKGKALFALKRLEALPEVGRQILALPPDAGLPDDMQAAARFWIGREAA